MDFQKASGHLADSKVYVLTEGLEYEGDWILATFATREAAELAKKWYESRLTRNSMKYFYDITEQEVLDQAPISKSQGTETPAVGAGPDPQHLPETGA